MLCLLSFIFVFFVVGGLEAGALSTTQSILYGAYGLIMLYHTSKKYWSDGIKNK